MVATLGYLVWRTVRRGELAADVMQRDSDAQERYIRDLLSWGWTVSMVARGCCGKDVSLPVPPIPPNGRVDTVRLTRNKRVDMRLTLVDRLSMDEMRDLAFDLGMNSEGNNTPASLARALVDHIDRYHLLDLARERLKKRDDIQL